MKANENVTTAYAIRADDGLVVFNDLSTNYSDVRIEGDTDANLFYTNASVDMIGIGTTAPTEKLTVTGNVSITQLIKLSAITLPTCATGTLGSLGRNTTGLYYCNSTHWKNIA